MLTNKDDAGWILGIGIATLDIINQVASYPPEDAEVRAQHQWIRPGGNVNNTLWVLRQLGHPCRWAGTLADDAGGTLIRKTFAARDISTEFAIQIPNAATPTSYIALSQATGSRTIIHHRDLRELQANDLEAISLEGCRWIHCEGRNPTETAKLIHRFKLDWPEIPISVEIEKPRDQLELLLRNVDVLIFSRAYVEAVTDIDEHARSSPANLATPPVPDPVAFLLEQRERWDAELFFLPWGAAGAYGLHRNDTTPCFVPAQPPSQIKDTLAAGDVFNAAAIDALLSGAALSETLRRANALAGFKCGQWGIDGLGRRL